MVHRRDEDVTRVPMNTLDALLITRTLRFQEGRVGSFCPGLGRTITEEDVIEAHRLLERRRSDRA